MIAASTNSHTHKSNIHTSKFKHSILKISILLMLCLSLSIPASASTYSGGSGTSGDPYLLSTDSDIDDLSATSADWNKYFILTQDITLVGNHTPIGDSSTKFTGNFNGSGFAVKNLTVYQTSDYAGFFGYTNSGADIHDLGVEISSHGVIGGNAVGGLVGYNTGGTVSNSYATGTVTGSGNEVGGLVGSNYGGTVSNSYANGTVISSGNSVGGLVGFSTLGTVSNSYATGNVTGSGNVGGLVGYNTGTVSNSYATGNVTGSGNSVGGLVGNNSGGTVSNSYATGNVSGSVAVGGLVGYTRYGNVRNSYSTGTVTGSVDVGGLVGYDESSTVTNNYYSGSTDAGEGTFTSFANFTSFAFVSGSSGLNWNASGNIITTEVNSSFIWKIDDGSSLPYFQYQDIAYSGGSGTEADPYLLSTDSDIDDLSATSADWNKYFILTQDITLVGNHTPIGNFSTQFTGNFNGSGFTIKNLTVYQTTYYAGFFGYAGSGANIHDIGIEISSDGVFSTTNYVGGLVGYNRGIVSNSYATGNITGGNDVGGLVGWNSGIVSNSYATGNITGGDWVGGLVGCNNAGTVTNCFATGTATGSSAVGGLVGWNEGSTVEASVTNCFATGTVTGSSTVGGLVGWNEGSTVEASVTNCFATGTVTGSSTVGGLVGYNHAEMAEASITNCFATGNVSGASFVGGLVGRNSAMFSTVYVTNSYYSGSPADTNGGISTSYANFTNFAFVSGSSGLNWNESGNIIITTDDSDFVWKIIDGYTLPYFQYQDIPAPLAPYVVSISSSSGINNSAGSMSFLLNVTGCSFNITDTVFVNLTIAGQTPINGTINSITYTTINTIFDLTQAIAGDWSLYVINPDGQTSIAKNFTVQSLFIPGTPESFTNTTGNFWVNHSWNAGTGDVSDSYNVSYNENWLNGTTDSFNHTGLTAHAWSNITVYAYNATDSILSAGVSDNVQVSNNAVSILNVTDITVYEGENVTFSINSTDADGDTEVFGCNNSALFDTFNTSTGEGLWVTDLSDAGTYYVEFNVSDGYGSVDSQVMTITINDTIIPVANFTASTESGYASLSVVFTDNSSNIPTAWFWDFGDGANSTLQNPAHTYSATGTYNVNLNASNFAGSNLSSNMTITVTTAPSSGSSSSGGSGSSGSLVIRETDTDESAESQGEDSTEEKSTKHIESVSFEADANGETLSDVTVWSSEETAYISISTGTKVTDASGNSGSSIRIVDIPVFDVPAARDVPEMDDAMALHAYKCTPDGTIFSPAIRLTFTLSEEEWKQYGESAKVGWYNDDTGEWEIIQGTADAGTRTITIQVSHFSTYALFGDDTGETVTETQDTDKQGMSMSWLWVLLLLVIVGGAGYYITQVKKKE